MMSRAVLGITRNNKVICALPGSSDAVSLALKKLLIPELSHIFWELKKNCNPKGTKSTKGEILYIFIFFVSFVSLWLI
jgi:molybdenum cofactor biosynthesis protein B